MLGSLEDGVKPLRLEETTRVSDSQPVYVSQFYLRFFTDLDL